VPRVHDEGDGESQKAKQERGQRGLSYCTLYRGACTVLTVRTVLYSTRTCPGEQGLRGRGHWDSGRKGPKCFRG
jgi:hypothetical protein